MRNEEGTENRSDCNMKKKNILQVVLNSRAYFGRLSPRKQNEHMLIGGKKKKKSKDKSLENHTFFLSLNVC